MGKGTYAKTGNTYKEEAIIAAKDLFYGPEVIKQLENAKTDNEIITIMHTARDGVRDRRMIPIRRHTKRGHKFIK